MDVLHTHFLRHYTLENLLYTVLCIVLYYTLHRLNQNIENPYYDPRFQLPHLALDCFRIHIKHRIMGAGWRAVRSRKLAVVNTDAVGEQDTPGCGVPGAFETAEGESCQQAEEEQTVEANTPTEATPTRDTIPTITVDLVQDGKTQDAPASPSTSSTPSSPGDMGLPHLFALMEKRRNRAGPYVRLEPEEMVNMKPFVRLELDELRNSAVEKDGDCGKSATAQDEKKEMEQKDGALKRDVMPIGMEWVTYHATL